MPPAAGKPRRLRAPAAGNGPPAGHAAGHPVGRIQKELGWQARVRPRRWPLSQSCAKLMQDKQIGNLVVPIVPDESRTFGMEAAVPAVRYLCSCLGQLYEPVDADRSCTYYKRRKTGRSWKRGITEAGSMSSFIAAGLRPMPLTASTPLPFFIYYSMFGFPAHRRPHLGWPATCECARASDRRHGRSHHARRRRALQHQDGHSHMSWPIRCRTCVMAYDPAFRLRAGRHHPRGHLNRMYEEQEDNVFYYITVENESTPMPPMPKGHGVEEGILKGMYKFRGSAENPSARLQGCSSWAAARYMNERVSKREHPV